MTNKEYEDILEASEIMMVAYPEWRPGQAFFNTLAKSEPEIAEEIRGSNLDMFHNKDRIEKFKEVYVK